VRWSAAVFDEAQKVKTPTALMTEAAKAINAEISLCLTGTPVENRLADIWCIVDLVQPGALGALKEFCSAYEPAGSYQEERLRALREKLQDSLPPIMLRRMKEDHLKGLPPIHVHVERRTMPQAQADAYSKTVEIARSSGGGSKILEALAAMKRVSLHPADEPPKEPNAFIQQSARWSYAFEVLDTVAKQKQKALIFLDALDLQGFLVEIIQKRYGLQAPPLIINGSVPGKDRTVRVDKFSERIGFDVMVLSPRAGGVGLTLTAANHVIHLDRWWNPAVEDQCTDRVYRIGQERDVHVYLPVAVHPAYQEHSFDVKLDELLSSKRRLSRTVLAPSGSTGEDLQSLFNETVTS
jgi:SNF2 family DNA or RNA helicase